MNREQAERIITEYLKPIYGFAVKRCANLQDAEDLTQEIVLRAFRALIVKENIETTEKFIWAVAHNTLANYYRSKSKSAIGVPIDELSEVLHSESDTTAEIIEKEAVRHLHMEIAHLARLQRRIVIAYYYENKKQEAIAKELGIPLGTVKWHLFESKKDLKKGLDTMREASELKFNPIKFVLCGTNGSPGTKGANNNFFRSALSQNIVYCVWKEAKTINEIADSLGVSPVYIESEAEYLAQYGFLAESRGKYICNILLDEADDKITALHDEMYQSAAKLFANELYDELTGSGILKDERIVCAQTDNPISLTHSEKADDNFILWSIVPYIAALSGESLMDKSVSFEQAATIRPDGGHNICYASVLTPDAKPPMYFESMRHWCGPCWNEVGGHTLWQIDSQWSSGRVDDGYPARAQRILSLFDREQDGGLTKDEYTFLAEQGFMKTNGEYDGMLKASWQIVWLENAQIKKELISIGDRIKERHWKSLQAMREPFVKAVLAATPKHLHTMQKYGLQYTFFSDGWFILHCLMELTHTGKLGLPTEEQRKALTAIIISNR